MSVRIMAAVFDTEGMSPTAKLVALAMADHASDDGRNIYPGLARLERKTGLSRASVQRAIKWLLENGYLAIEKHSTATMPTVYRMPVEGGITVTPLPRRGVSQSRRGGIRVIPGGYQGDTLTIINHHETSQKNELTISTPEATQEALARIRTKLGRTV